MILVMTIKKKIIIFDLDGTILNTIGGIYNALSKSFIKYGYKMPKDYTLLKKNLGHGPRHLVKAYLPSNVSDKVLNEILNDYTKIYNKEYLYDTNPYPGILELLKELKDDGNILGVVSNKQEVIVKRIIEKLFPNIFTYIIGAVRGIKLKPEIDMFNPIIKDYPKRSDIIFIGDSDVDFYTSKNLGVSFIGCSYGFRGRKILSDIGVLYIADNVDMIRSYLFKLCH